MPAALIALAIASAPVALPAPTADDCAIAVALGQKVFQWGTPNAAAFALDPELGQGAAPPETHWDNRSVDLVRCPWTHLGAPALSLASADSRDRFWIRGPTYDAKGGATATVVVVQKLPADAPHRTFFEALSCSFTKASDSWALTDCRLAGIS